MSKKKRRLWLNKPKCLDKNGRKYLLLNITSLHCKTPSSNKKCQYNQYKFQTPKWQKVTAYTSDRKTIPLGNSHHYVFTESNPVVDSELSRRYAVTWIRYYRYSVKPQTINQSTELAQRFLLKMIDRKWTLYEDSCINQKFGHKCLIAPIRVHLILLYLNKKRTQQ